MALLPKKASEEIAYAAVSYRMPPLNAPTAVGTLDVEIEAIAERYIVQGLSSDLFLRDELPADLRDRVEATVGAIQRTLDDKDHELYGGYAAIFARGRQSGEREIAKAKFSLLVDKVRDRLWSERYLSGQFGTSQLLEQYPEMADHMDEDGLLPARLFKPLPDAFAYRGHAVFPSEALPYGLHRLLTEVAHQPAMGLRFQPAHYRLCALAEYRERLFEAVIRGPAFQERQLRRRLFERNIVTVLKRCPKNEREAAFLRAMHPPVERLEVGRTEQGDRISFLAEELLPLGPSTDNWIRTKIFHSDLNLPEERFAHADVTVLIYGRERYERRLSATVMDKIKAEGHHKLFWLAGCKAELWSEIFYRTYPGNELVEEYLTSREWSLGEQIAEAE